MQLLPPITVAACLLTFMIYYCNGAIVQSQSQTQERPRPKSKSVKLSNHPVILVVSFDGFRYDYIAKAKVTPWLNALRNSGVTVPYMEPTFPTKTFPNHQSIATGLYAETHGIVDNVLFDPEFNGTLSGFNDDPGFWNYHPEVLPIWILNEKAGEGRVSGCAMWPGSSQPYGSKNSLLPTHYYPEYNGSIPWEERVDTVISWITDDKKPANLVFLYYDEPDTHGHAFGPNSEETIRQVEMADNRTAYLVNKLIDKGIYDKINLIILSDHGMKEVTQKNIIYLDTLIDGDDLLEAKYGGTPVLQLVPREEKEEELYDKLTQLSNDYNFKIWKKEELGYPFYYNTSRRIADFIVLADSGYAFDDFNSTIKYYNEQWGLIANDSREYGVHGYSNAIAAMRPFFLGHGPVFRKGYEHTSIKNVDIVPLICEILGIPEPPTNGSLSRVEEMIDPNVLSRNSSGTSLTHSLRMLTIAVILKIIY